MQRASGELLPVFKQERHIDGMEQEGDGSGPCLACEEEAHDGIVQPNIFVSRRPRPVSLSSSITSLLLLIAHEAEQEGWQAHSSQGASSGKTEMSWTRG